MSTFNTALGSIWGAVGGTLGIVTDATNIASKFIQKHRIQQNVGHVADIEMFTSSKMLEVDQSLQRNAEARSMINRSLVDQERERVNQILSQL